MEIIKKMAKIKRLNETKSIISEYPIAPVIKAAAAAAPKAAAAVPKVSKHAANYTANLAKAQQEIAAAKAAGKSGAEILKIYLKYYGNKALSPLTLGAVGNPYITPSRSINLGLNYGAPIGAQVALSDLSGGDPTQKTSIWKNALLGGLGGVMPTFDVGGTLGYQAANAGARAAGGDDISAVGAGLAGGAMGWAGAGKALSAASKLAPSAGPVAIAAGAATGAGSEALKAKWKNDVAQIYQDALNKGTLTPAMLQAMDQNTSVARLFEPNAKFYQAMQDLYKQDPKAAEQTMLKAMQDGYILNDAGEQIPFINDARKMHALYYMKDLSSQLLTPEFQQNENNMLLYNFLKAVSEAQSAEQIDALYNSIGINSLDELFNAPQQQLQTPIESSQQVNTQTSQTVQPIVEQPPQQIPLNSIINKTYSFDTPYGPITATLLPNGQVKANHSMIGNIQATWKQTGPNSFTVTGSAMGQTMTVNGTIDDNGNVSVNGVPAQPVQ